MQQRQIKFRIWNPLKGAFEKSGGTPSMLSGFFNQTATLNTLHERPYEQFTGLLDKNGKEIYEGDIVKHGLFGLFEVEAPTWFQCDAFDCYGYEFASNDVDGPRYMSECEVIGNIHENPELLKVEN